MRERINKLAKGIVDAEVPMLVIRPEALEEPIRADERVKKEFFVTSENATHLKGLVYSSNARVRLVSGTFGGTRNHIGFEVNSNHLSYGDVIEGTFHLVTNGGEKEIPYSFRVDAGDSGKILAKLKTPEDFSNMARKDFELALRLFEYQDFTEVPFMQNLHIRAVYDGLKGQGSRQAGLESFLIALKQKKAVRIQVPEKTQVFMDPKEPVQAAIEIGKEGWGYCPVMVKADGDFIQLSQKMISDSDFRKNSFSFTYQISPSRLHGGRNYGAITFSTITQTVTVPVKVINTREEEEEKRQIRYGRYFSLRLDYECGTYEKALLRNQMLEEVEQLKLVYGEDETLALISAELYALAGQKEQVRQALESCKQKVMENRQKRVDLYCLMQYIALMIEPDEGKKASLLRLLHKYVEDGKPQFLLYALLLRLDETVKKNPADVLNRLRDMYLADCHSPFLYLQAAEMFNQMPELIYNMGSFEIQVLYFGTKRGMVEEELAMKAARLAGSAKYYNRLYCSMLMLLYEKYPAKEMLGAICALLIKGERQGPEDFLWYEKSLKQQISLTRLYEYYLFSLPADYKQLLPKEVLLYFSYDHELDRHSKSVLYKNILMYMNPEAPLYREYEKRIREFATEQIFQSRINSRLAVIYQHMLYPDMIDLPVAKVLPGILKSYRICCDKKDMKYVVVCYEELTEDGIYPLEDGIAYIPIFSKHSQILFQDAYGNRHADVGYTKTSVIDRPELEERCFEVYPEQPMLLLKASRESLGKETLTEEDVLLLERALNRLKLHSLYKKVLTSRIIEYYRLLLQTEEGAEAGADSGYLLTLDKATLTRQQRRDICETFISQNYIKEAYEMIKEYGYEDISTKRLLKLCTKMILQRLFDQDELLLKLAYQVFEDEKSDSVILDYLCEYFNGTTEQMHRILKQGIIEHVETYDLEERLLAQMLFSGNTANMDQVFTLYMKKKKTGESIVKAYFTMKSYEYFIYGTPADDQVFAYLEGMINGAIEKDKVATVHLLALTKYYSTLPLLEEDQKQLCQNLVNILLEEGMVFPFFKKLANHISIPNDVLDKGIIQYIGQKDSGVELEIRILPDEEEYHSDDMKRVYQGVFIKQKILFDGEIMEYQVFERNGEKRVLMEEGSVTCELPASGAGSSRFDCLNQMSLCLSLKEEEGLKRNMKEYLQKTAVVEELFDLM